MKIAEIEKLSKKQLMELKLQIERKLYGFWDAIDELKNLEKEETIIREYLELKFKTAKAKSKQLQDIEQLGFRIVIYGDKDVGIINYKKPKKDGKYYGVRFAKETNSISHEHNAKPSDEDIEKIREILEIPHG